MLETVASLVVGAVLLAAAAAKAADRPGSVVALATYGLAGRAAPVALGALIAVEGVAGAGLLAGWAPAAPLAVALLTAFTAGQAAALATGRGGASCGCLGARGKLGGWSLARTAALLALASAVVAGGLEATPAWAGFPVAGVALLAALWRRRPEGALDVAGEGPELHVHSALDRHLPAPVEDDRLRLVVFTSQGCGLCRRLKPSIARLARTADAEIHVLDEERDAAAWLAARVPGSPYAVVLDGEGIVRGRGTVNTGRQLRSLLKAAAVVEKGPDTDTSSTNGVVMGRRGLLRLGAGAAGAATLTGLVRPGEAEAYHFCGHIYTTDSCPHPTGLPRIDGKGYPLRARDGHPVDDLGRLIDRAGRAVDEDGRLLADADGRPLPVATRTKVCTATGREYRIPVRVDGSWYRCCKGNVRKLVDCCSTHPKRINGDKSLKGYCYADRKVFCVMFFQTKVPC